MRILIIPNFSPSCTGNKACDVSTEEFISGLLKKGHEVNVVGLSFNVKNKTIINHKYKAIIYPRYENKLISYLYFMFVVLRDILASDFVYIFYPAALRYVIIWCWLLNKPYGVHIRGQRNLTDLYSRLLYRFSKATITMADDQTKMLKLINSKNKIYTLERSLVPYSEKDINVDRKYSNKDKYKILYLGRLVFDKGIGELINAIYILNNKYKFDFELNIYGYGNFNMEAQELVSKFNLNNKVFFKGAVWDFVEKAEIYRTSDMFILPSYHEGFPQSIHEAMIFGTPIITTFVGSIPTLMKDRCNCLRIEPKSVQSIVEALAYAMENYETMGTFAKIAMTDISELVDTSKLSHADQLLKYLSNS